MNARNDEKSRCAAHMYNASRNAEVMMMMMMMMMMMILIMVMIMMMIQ